MDKSAKVLMAETVALASDRMFAEIRYKSLYMETYMVKQIISPPIKLFNLAEIFICKQRSNEILTCYGRRNDTFFANRPLTGVTITFIRCLYRVTGVSIGQGYLYILQKFNGKCRELCCKSSQTFSKTCNFPRYGQLVLGNTLTINENLKEF